MEISHPVKIFHEAICRILIFLQDILQQTDLIKNIVVVFKRKHFKILKKLILVRRNFLGLIQTTGHLSGVKFLTKNPEKIKLVIVHKKSVENLEILLDSTECPLVSRFLIFTKKIVYMISRLVRVSLRQIEVEFLQAGHIPPFVHIWR